MLSALAWAADALGAAVHPRLAAARAGLPFRVLQRACPRVAFERLREEVQPTPSLRGEGRE